MFNVRRKLKTRNLNIANVARSPQEGIEVRFLYAVDRIVTNTYCSHQHLEQLVRSDELANRV